MANCSYCGVAEGVEHHGWCNDANWGAEHYRASPVLSFTSVPEPFFLFRSSRAEMNISRCEMEDCADRRAFRKLVGDRLQELYNVAMAEWDKKHPNGGE